MTERAGLSFPDMRHDIHVTAMKRAMKSAGLRQLSALYNLLQHDDAAVEALAAELTIGETYFFRDAGQFQLLRERILPEISGRKSEQEPIRIWSAGCATGEEAYSLAIVMAELGLAERAHIIGTDIARDRLERAHAGVYGRWSFRGVSDAVRGKYFDPSGRGFRLKSGVRKCVEFRYLNLAEDACPSFATGIWGMDLVLCRNVLIYFEPAAVQNVTQALIDSLAADGWLLLGASDPATHVMQQCAVIVTNAGLVYRQSKNGTASSEPVALPSAPRVDAPQPKTPASPSSSRSLSLSASRPASPPRDARATAVTDDATAVVAHVRGLADAGHLIQAERACVRGRQQHPESAELAYLHSILLAEQGHYDAALRAARQTLYLAPGLVVGHLALASIWLRMHNRAAAARSFRNAEQLLADINDSAIVPASGGEPAGRLLELTRAQLRLALGRAS